MPNVEGHNTPVAVIREQASLLGELTNGLVRGAVHTSGSDLVVHELNLIVPALNNYTYTLLFVRHDPLTLYPVYIGVPAWAEGGQAENEAEFTELLEQYLRDERTQSVLRSLIMQARDIESRS